MFSFLATALALSSTTLAFSRISVPSSITADVSAQIRLTASDFDSQFDLYRVYLAMTPPGWGTGPACYLVNSSSTSITDFNVNIPASVGPSDSGEGYYSISIMEFNSDPNAESSASGFTYSSNFDFEGGTGNWSAYETSGHSVSDADTLPCSAYDCARNCSQTYFPADVADTNDETAYRAAYECVGRCPSVVQPSWEELAGATVTTAGGGSGSSTSTGVSTTAASRTTSGATASGSGTSVPHDTVSSSSGSRTSSATSISNTATAATSTSTNGSVQMKAGVMLALVASVFALVL